MDPPNRILLRSSETENTGPEMGLLLGRALAMDYHKVVIATDLMKSSTMMKEALVAGLLSAGVDVLDIGVASGPVVGMAASKGDCAVYVTEYRRSGTISGYILINSDGSLFRKDQIRHLDRILIDPPKLPGHDGLGRVLRCSTAVQEYNSRLESLIARNPGCSVVLDCGCGPVSGSAPMILRALGADVMTLNAQSDMGCSAWDFREDGSDDADVKEIVGSNPGCIGITMNKIGTVAAVVNEKGVPLTHEQVFAIIIGKMEPMSIAVPIDTSLVVLDAFRKLPADPDRKAVFTDISVGAVCSAVAEGADIGYYEGGVIYCGISLMPDGIRTAAILTAMAGEDSLNKLAEELTVCYRESKETECGCPVDSFIRKMESEIEDVPGELHSAGGAWRIDMEGGWFLVSVEKGEEPMIRIDAESRDRVYLLGLMEIADGLVAGCMKGA